MSDRKPQHIQLMVKTYMKMKMRMTKTSCTSDCKKGTVWRRTWSSHWWRRPCTSGSSETFETSSGRTATEEKGNTSMAGSNCYTETTGVKGLARARRGDLDFGQKVRWRHAHSAIAWADFEQKNLGTSSFQIMGRQRLDTKPSFWLFGMQQYFNIESYC